MGLIYSGRRLKLLLTKMQRCKRYCYIYTRHTQSMDLPARQNLSPNKAKFPITGIQSTLVSSCWNLDSCMLYIQPATSFCDAWALRGSIGISTSHEWNSAAQVTSKVLFAHLLEWNTLLFAVLAHQQEKKKKYTTVTITLGRILLFLSSGFLNSRNKFKHLIRLRCLLTLPMESGVSLVVFASFQNALSG